MADCDNTYGTFEYGTGREYGPSTCPATLFIDIDTPAGDLMLLVTSVEFVVDAAYLSTANYTVVDQVTGDEVGIREVLKPFDDVVSDRIILVTDRHVAGREYEVTLRGLLQRTGVTQDPTTGLFFARDAKADSMISAIPGHFNTDPQVSTMRHLLQAISESDDQIGSL